ncbi:hypothetical protein CPB84DRAFT_1871985 [Gymnopilus junonius]|uniref:Uncharacterized protein n=1 Tax=Gymnopilus junonius TaxID=109634 RepID=A0A9P5NGB6_GYMJU|nr:hypothetical protein CPB84DRAFT_1871985 [Gymnopilus junonius]
MPRKFRSRDRLIRLRVALGLSRTSHLFQGLKETLRSLAQKHLDVSRTAGGQDFALSEIERETSSIEEKDICITKNFNLTSPSQIAVHKFLEACKPSMIEFLPHFLQFGCINEEYLQAFANFPPKWRQEVLRKVVMRNESVTEKDLTLLEDHLVTSSQNLHRWCGTSPLENAGKSIQLWYIFPSGTMAPGLLQLAQRVNTIPHMLKGPEASWVEGFEDQGWYQVS